MQMTEGNTGKIILRFALPCVLANVLQNVYNLVDSALMGAAQSTMALAAVAASGSVMTLCVSTITGLMNGFSISAGSAYGGADSDKLRKIFSASLSLSIVIGLLLSVGGTFASRGILLLLRTPAEILDDAATYLRVIFLGIWATVFYNLLCEMLRAVGNSKIPLRILAAASVLHLVLIWLLVIRLKRGVAGAALSTGLSQLFAAALCAVYIARKVPCFHLHGKDWLPDPRTVAECLRVGLPLALMNFVVMFGVILLQFVTNKIGAEYVAAYGCASRIGYILTTPVFGLATAASVFAAQNLGAGRIDRIRDGLRKTILFASAANAVIFCYSLFLARPTLRLFLRDSETAVEAGVTYLRIRCSSAFVLTFAAVYKSVLSGLKRTLFPTLSAGVEIAIRYAVPIFFSEALGFFVVPLTDGAAWAVLALFLFTGYRFEMKKRFGGKHEKQLL